MDVSSIPIASRPNVMMDAAHCPSRQTLCDFVNHELDDAESEQILGHLDTCASCESTVTELASEPGGLFWQLRHADEPKPRANERELQRALDRVQSPAWIVETLRRADTADEEPFRSGAATESAAAASLGWVGEYELLQWIGRGGMGEVFRARERLTRREVAVKRLAPNRLGDDAARKRFDREIKAVALVEHENVVKAHCAFEHGGQTYLVMEWVDGPNASQLTSHGPPLSVANACEIVRHAALGLQAIHQAKLVHRDIKPSNLLISRSGQVKIGDLGLAVLYGENAPEEELTLSGQVVGTVDYVAPEQAKPPRGIQIDIRADIYSLGCTIHRLLTGSPPFSGPAYANAYEKLHAHVTEQPASLCEIRSDVPESLAELVSTRMLAKDRTQRFATPAEAAEALRPFAAGNDLSVLVSRVADSPELIARRSTISGSGELRASNLRPQRFARASSHHLRIGLAALAAGIVLAVVVWAVVFPRGRRSATQEPHTNERWVAGSAAELPGAIPFPMRIAGIPAWQVTTQLPGSAVYAVACNPASDLLAIGCQNGELRLYELSGDELELRQIRLGHSREIQMIAWSRDGQRLVSCSSDSTVRVWDVAKGALETTWTTDFSPFTVAWCAEGCHVASGGDYGNVQVWEATGTKLIRYPEQQGHVQTVAWHPHRHVIASAGDDNVVRLRALDGTELIPSLTGHTASIRFLAWHPDGDWLASSADDGTVRLWDVKTGDGQIVMDNNGEDRVVAWSPDGNQLAMMGSRLRFWNRSNRSVQASEVELTLDGGATISWSRDGKRIVLNGTGAGLQVWDAEGTATRPLFHNARAVVSIAWHPDGSELLAGCTDGTVRRWSETGLPEPKHRTHGTDDVGAVAWSRDGQQFGSARGYGGGPEYTIRVWDTAGRKMPREFGQSDITFHAIAFSPDGRRLAAGKADGAKNEELLQVWDTGSGQLDRSLIGHTGEVTTVEWDPVSGRLASGGSDRKVLVWSMEAAEPPQVVAENLPGPVRSVAWSPDGQWLAYAVRSGSGEPVAVLDTNTWQVALRRRTIGVQPGYLAWGPDSRRLVCGEVGVFDMDAGDLIPGSHEVTLGCWHLAATRQSNRPRFAAGTYGYNIVQVFDLNSLKREWTSLLLPDATATFSTAGQLLNPDPHVIRHLRYVIREPSGEQKLLTYTEFLQRAGERAE